MSDDTISSRLARIEVMQEQHGENLRRTTVAVESIAVISERMANHIEDTKRMHSRLDGCEADIFTLQQHTVETMTFYRDVKKGLIALLGAVLAAGTWLLTFWVDRH